MMKRYLRILVCGFALQCNALPALANFDFNQATGGTITHMFSFDSGTTPAGTSNCAAASTECPASIPINTAGSPLFITATPGIVAGPGTAGTPTGGVVSVQGVGSGTALPISVASLPLPTSAATSALQGTGNTSLASILTALGSPFQAGGSVGNTGFNALQAGTANIAGNPFFVSPGTGASFTVVQATASSLNMTCANCSGSGASGTDLGGFTATASIFAPSGGFFQNTATSNPLTNGTWGVWQMTANRAGFVNLRNASGAEIGVAAAPVQVSLANTGSNGTPVSVNATLQASGTTAIGKVDPNTIATWGLSTVGAGTAPTNAQVIGCIQASPTPSANQSVAVSCDATGNVKVVGTGILDTSSFSQPTTQGSGVLGLVNTSARSGLTNATMSYLSLDATAALRVAIVSGAGSGGTASNFGSAFPTAGTAMGASDGTNMVGVRASNFGTSPGAVTALATNSFVTNTVAENITQVAGTTISATNPLFTNISVGSAAISATNGLYSNILQGNAVLSISNPAFVKNVATATGGTSTAGAIAPNNTTAVVVKSGAGTLYALQLYGINAAPLYVKFYNATSATCGSGTPVKRVMIPAAGTAANGAGSNVDFGPTGVNFSTGITYCATTGITDADNTAPTANNFLINVDYL